MSEQSFADLGLTGRLQRALKDARYISPTPIQQRAIPLQLEGADLLGIAQTGTGKTAAFVLPMLQNLVEDGERPAARSTRALILVPTRELAQQISDAIRTYGKYTKLRHGVIIGGVPQQRQVKMLQGGVDIIIATPGRMVDLLTQGRVRFDTCRYLVIDEADRMLDMGFIRDVRKLVASLPRERQSMLFSATMPQPIVELAGEMLVEPERVEIKAKSVAVERIEQRVHHVAKPHKRELLIRLLDAPDLSKVIVFTRTKRGADQVAKRLGAAGIKAGALHGNKSQNQRQRTLDGFRSGRARVLVATDIAARGIDIDDVTHVINYELPHEPESYVHRIGRTARAGAEGIAISLCDTSEHAQLRAIERLMKLPLQVVGKRPVELVVDKAKGEKSKTDGRRRPRRQRRQRPRPTAA